MANKLIQIRDLLPILLNIEEKKEIRVHLNPQSTEIWHVNMPVVGVVKMQNAVVLRVTPKVYLPNGRTYDDGGPHCLTSDELLQELSGVTDWKPVMLQMVTDRGTELYFREPLVEVREGRRTLFLYNRDVLKRAKTTAEFIQGLKEMCRELIADGTAEDNDNIHSKNNL